MEYKYSFTTSGSGPVEPYASEDEARAAAAKWAEKHPRAPQPKILRAQISSTGKWPLDADGLAQGAIWEPVS